MTRAAAKHGTEQAAGTLPVEEPRRPSRLVRIEVSLKTLLSAAGIVCAALIFVRLWPVLLVILVALILVGTLNPAVSALERKGVRRPWAVAFVFLASVTLVGVICLLAMPPLWREVGVLLQQAPETQSKLAEVLAGNPMTRQIARAIAGFRPEQLFGGDPATALNYSTFVAVMLGYAGSSVVLALYLVADRDRARGALYALIPRRYHVRLARVLLSLETIVGGYMRGQLVTSAAVALFVFLLLVAFRIPGALAFAVLAGFTDVIPLIGGLLATVPASLAAMERGPGIALTIFAILVLYQEFENRVLVPQLYGQALRLPPAGVIVALLIGGKLLGIIGALLALPVAAALRMLVEELRVELPGDDSDDQVTREQDRRAELVYALRTSGAPPDEAAAVASEIADQPPKP